MATSDITALLDKARNQSSSGCKVTAALKTLPPADRDKLAAALMERSRINNAQWAYVADRLVDVFNEVAPEFGVTKSSIDTYRKSHRG
jgi:hypothetical protein